MRFKRIIMVFCFGLVFAPPIWTNAVHAVDTAYQVWRCTDNGIGGSWCNNLPGCSNCYNWHVIFGWSRNIDSYDCFGHLISTGGGNNYLTCLTHGGPVGTCSEVMGTGTYPRDCFASGDTGCGTIDYGTHHCWDIVDVRPPQMGACLLPGADKNRGRPRKNLCENFIKNPINVVTGNKYEEVLDIAVSTSGIPLEFRRSYNSQWFSDGPLGYGWTHSYNLVLAVVQTAPTKRIRIWDSDGRALYFNQVQQTSSEILFGGESGVKDRLKQVISTGEYYLRRKEGNLTYKFSSDGKLLEISDPNGNILTLTYTGVVLTQVSDNFGKSLSIQYNNNHISSVTDPKSQSVSYQYQSGDLWKVTYPDANFITYAYSNHNLTDKYDTNNNMIGHWQYDGLGRVNLYYSHLKDGIQQDKVELQYDYLQTKVIRRIGETNYETIYTLQYIDRVSVIKEIQGCSACGNIHNRFEYTQRVDVLDLEAVTSINDSDGAEITTEYTYDAPTYDPTKHWWEQVGEVVQKTEALNWPEQRTTSYTYTHRTNDPFLLTQSTETRKSVVDSQQNKVITLTYDTAGNILSRQETGYVFINGVPTPKTYTTQYQYNTLGQLTQINGPRTDVSDITIFEYYANTPGEGNNRGQLKAIVNALGQRTQSSEYDANGNVGKISDPNNVITQKTYDERNGIKTITNLSTGAQTQYFYDVQGNLSYIILPEANRIDFAYNFANKLKKSEITWKQDPVPIRCGREPDP